MHPHHSAPSRVQELSAGIRVSRILGSQRAHLPHVAGTGVCTPYRARNAGSSPGPALAWSNPSPSRPGPLQG